MLVTNAVTMLAPTPTRELEVVRWTSPQRPAVRRRACRAMSKRPADSEEAGWIPDKLSRKKQKKAKHRLAKGLGTLEECLAVYGAGARVELELKDNSPVLPVHEVQNLLLWMLTQGLGHMPQWVVIRNKPLLRGAAVVVVPALDAPELSHAAGPGFTAPRLVRMPKVSATALQELLRVKLQKPPKGSAAAKAAKATAAAATAAAAATTAADAADAAAAAAATSALDARPPHGWSLSYVREFALSPREQHENGYPLVVTPPKEGVRPSGCAGAAAEEPPRADESSEDEAAEAVGEAGGAAAARTAHGRGARARLLGVDCEMCYAGEALQLARVAVVGEALQPAPQPCASLAPEHPNPNLRPNPRPEPDAPSRSRWTRRGRRCSTSWCGRRAP